MSPERTSSLSRIVEVIRKANPPPSRSTLLIALDGCGGSGKTTMSRAVADVIEGVTSVCADDFARPKVPGWDWNRFREQVITPLLLNHPSRYQRYDWETDSPAEWHDVPTGGILLVDGVSVTRHELDVPWDLTMWIDCPPDLRLARGLARDGEQAREMWTGVWMQEEDRYVETQRPHERCDLVIEGATLTYLKTT